MLFMHLTFFAFFIICGIAEIDQSPCHTKSTELERETMLKLIGSLEPGRPTVLFLAGSITSPCVFDQVESDGVFQFAAVDYCRSEGPWDVDTLGGRVLSLMEEKQLGPTILAGYSAGGVIAMSAACQGPDRIAGMLLSNTGPCSKGHGDPSFPQKLLDNWDNPAFLDSFLARCFSRPIPPLLRQRLLDYIGTLDPQSGYQVSTSLRQVDYREGLRQVRFPVVIAHGKDDKTRTLAHVEMMTTSMPHAEVFLLDGGHTIMVENKPQWQEALNHLMKKVLAAQN